MSILTEQEVLDVLCAIDRGEVTILEEDKRAAEAQYCNNVTLHASNGWTFVVFNDCDEWDYLDEATAPDGRSISYKDINGWDPSGDAKPPPFGQEPMPELAVFEPEHPHETWGFG